MTCLVTFIKKINNAFVHSTIYVFLVNLNKDHASLRNNLNFWVQLETKAKKLIKKKMTKKDS